MQDMGMEMGQSQKRNTRTMFNPDPTLGGRFFNAPELTPTLTFTKAVSLTPNSNKFIKIIPWDHLNKDFVYSTVDEKIFKDKMTRQDLKKVSPLKLK